MSNLETLMTGLFLAPFSPSVYYQFIIHHLWPAESESWWLSIISSLKRSRAFFFFLWVGRLPRWYFSSSQSLSRVRLFVTPWTAACQASLSITNSRSLPKPMSIESVIPSQVALLVKNPLANAEDVRNTRLTPVSGRSPGGGHGNPLQYSCLENSMDGGAWWATVCRVTKSWTYMTEQMKTQSSSESIILYSRRSAVAKSGPRLGRSRTLKTGMWCLGCRTSTHWISRYSWALWDHHGKTLLLVN